MDFTQINNELLARSEDFVKSILPEGKIEGKEYVSRNPTRQDSRLGSFKIHLESGRWADFATGDKGGDLIALYAYIKGIKQVEAAKEISERYLNLNIKKPEKKPKNWQVIIPVPVIHDEPPKNHFKFGKYSHRWTYTDFEGKLLGYIYRFDFNGSKEICPLTWCKDEKENRQWRWKCWDKPRPIYNVKTLYDMPDAPVFIVEGEKCAEAGQKTFPQYCWISWFGGVFNWQFTDFEILKNRNVLLFPDNDPPGLKCMYEIYEKYKDICNIKFILPKEKPIAWDIADAVQGMSPQAIMEFIQKNIENNPEKINLKPDRSKELVKLDLPFIILGYYKNEFFYLPKDMKQIISLSPNNHTPKNLLTLAPLNWWERNFPRSKYGCDWDSAIDTLFRMSTNTGLFDERKIRGCGAWFDGGRIVVHNGDHLLVDGFKMDINEIKSKYIYEYSNRVNIFDAKPIDVMSARKFMGIVELLAWEKPIYAKLLAGWCVIASICGALYWRPHIWLTGSADSGKSWILDNIVKPVISRTVLTVQSNTTEAGIRQTLQNNAFPIIFDEAEGEDAESRKRIKTVIELMRQSSSEFGAPIIKGSQSGHSIQYSVRSTFCFASVGTFIIQNADQSRITVLSLVKHPVEQRRTIFEQMKRMCLNILTKDYCAGFQSRAISMIKTIRENSEIFSKVFASLYGSQRAGDQIGTLIAGTFSLYTDDIVTPEVAKEFIENNKSNWDEYKIIETDTDEKNCLNTILCTNVPITGSGNRVERSLLFLAGIVAGIKAVRVANQNVIPTDLADEVMKNNGIKVSKDQDLLYISNSHPRLIELMENSPFQNWARFLRRIDGTEEIKSCRFECGYISRAVSIPINQIFSDSDILDNEGELPF